MFQHLFSRTDVFLPFITFFTFLTSLLMTVCKRLKKAIKPFALATIFLILFIEEFYSKHKTVTRQASLSEPQYEPVYNIYPLSNKILKALDT